MTPPGPTAEVVIRIDTDNGFFWEAPAGRRLVAQRCAACGRLWFPPSSVCPHWGALDWTIAELPHEGTIYSAARIHAPGSPIQGTDYLVVLVEIADPQRPGDDHVDRDRPDSSVGAPDSVTPVDGATVGRWPRQHQVLSRTPPQQPELRPREGNPPVVAPDRLDPAHRQVPQGSVGKWSAGAANQPC